MGKEGRQVEVGLGMGAWGTDFKRAMEGLEGHKRWGHRRREKEGEVKIWGVKIGVFVSSSRISRLKN